eukprot:CAMPEP_0195095426 /NCGR_PEP_ID=MMETSP0448-20130528/46844_1 /TAXON_ID=66468 /ORGANISM="Heterocapsa triquestra, Strain CCMP 448" /LENGTH=73 /DNA_ID=CAMNT_0040129633 /DNA_START=70 /DNA_END=288 /DNA_ORIENTATION=-
MLRTSHCDLGPAYRLHDAARMLTGISSIPERTARMMGLGRDSKMHVFVTVPFRALVMGSGKVAAGKCCAGARA